MHRSPPPSPGRLAAWLRDPRNLPYALLAVLLALSLASRLILLT